MVIHLQKKGAFTVANAMKKVNKELSSGHNVIIDTRNLMPEQVVQLRQVIDAAGIGNQLFGIHKIG